MTALTETADKIKSMEIRGAGKIARAAAGALKEEALSIRTNDIKEFNKRMDEAYNLLYSTRPTAVSLPNALRAVMRYNAGTVAEARQAIVSNADAFIAGSENAVKRIGEIGAHRIKDGDTIMTHCNSSAAFSIFETAFKQGKKINVIATETRPRQQGYVTVDFLQKAGIPTTLILDSAVRYTMKKVDLVIVGADAITVNGSLVNKVGTSQVALAANEARVGFICAAETYKFSPRTLFGEMVEIEERDPAEVLCNELRMKWPNLRISNPAFDITPHKFIDMIITEIGAISPEMAYWVIKDKLGWELEETAEANVKGCDDEN
ncbi:MAG TPA: ribose 1,5-bisphosphate isomerase [Methanocella sp.]|uniref:ribose 1,5-bisphosphate isomerase n=1 Tax=Methanocella sp. TaxID=2052833 RepID=UPI002BF859F7|nr:ribose 1,5-bisphosphate isomerase [Methanocella sp.]HTY91230.1 ribose 1,5-bisphosphate isomerase [Methanocella sp.]